MAIDKFTVTYGTGHGCTEHASFREAALEFSRHALDDVPPRMYAPGSDFETSGLSLSQSSILAALLDSEPFVCCQHWKHLREPESGRVFCMCIDCLHSWAEYPLLPTAVYL